MLVNTDNGANIKKGLRDLSKLEMSVKEEPHIYIEEEDIDDWTSFTPTAISDEIQSSSSSYDLNTSCPISVQDMFHPVSLEEEQNWSEGNYTDVTQVIDSLEDQFVKLMDNQRVRSLSRLPCFCHLLQVQKPTC